MIALSDFKKNFKSMKQRVKKFIDDTIIKLSYRNPRPWLEINEWIFDMIDECEKKNREKMYQNVRDLMNKLK